MSKTERYRTQHGEIMRLAGDLERELVSKTLAADAGKAREVLSQLTGKLLVHLAAEDNLLYPQLLKSSESATRSVAERFSAEMKPISESFKSYASRWASARTIQTDAEGFVKETRAICKALGERIRREHAELYPLADSD